MRNKVSPGEYLAFLSAKYEIDPDRFFSALISAGENQESTCGDLSIRCRGKLQDARVLLITKGPRVVAQFSVSNAFLMEQNNPIKGFRKRDLLRGRLIRRNDGQSFLHIGDLRNGMKKVSLRARVMEIAKPILVFTRYGNYASVANASITDETGTIKLCLWNEQIDSVSAGETVQIQNAHVSTFRGERQLRIGKKGMLTQVQDIACH